MVLSPAADHAGNVALGESDIDVREQQGRTQTRTRGETATDRLDIRQLDILGRIGSGRRNRGTERPQLAEADRVAIEQGGDHFLLQLVEHGEAVGAGHRTA